MSNLEQYDMPNSHDFEVWGRHIKEGRFELVKVVDTHHRETYLIGDCSFTESVRGFDNHQLTCYSINITEDAFLSVRSRQEHIPVPSMFQMEFPFVEGDDFHIRNSFRVLLMQYENTDDGIDGLVNINDL